MKVSSFFPQFRFTILSVLVVGGYIAVIQPCLAQANIVPNPGFENYEGMEDPWFYNGSHLGKVMHFWESPTGASPDGYCPKITVPNDWKERGFGNQKTHSGKGMIGLTMYGCLFGKPHCREYAMALLNEPIIKGQNYYVEYWVARLPGAMAIDRIGLAFSDTRIRRTLDDMLPLSYAVQPAAIVGEKPGNWVKISGLWKADMDANYLLVGNFSTDSETRAKKRDDTKYSYAYYYIDDLLIKKVPPYFTAPKRDDDLLTHVFVEDEYVRLRDIYFDYDRSELHPRSNLELSKLETILKKNPQMYVELIGHTDSDGDDSYNNRLSLARAESARRWLLKKGIKPARIKILGMGEARPIDTNETEEGKATNRRVELHVLKL